MLGLWKLQRKICAIQGYVQLENLTSFELVMSSELVNFRYFVSIDIGAYGFTSFYCEYEAPHLSRMVQDWGQRAKLSKNLCAILIEKETMQTIDIGFDAKELYNMSLDKREDEKYSYFQNFIAHLYSLAFTMYLHSVNSNAKQLQLFMYDFLTI